MTLKDKLISKIIVGNNLQSYDNGWNAALILAYKELALEEVSLEKVIKPKSEILNYCDINQYKEILAYIKSSEKLHAVKLMKEYSGLGLKEAKDLIDKEILLII